MSEAMKLCPSLLVVLPQIVPGPRALMSGCRLPAGLRILSL